MSELAAFQDAFSRALDGRGGLHAFGSAPAVAAGFSVYRNTSAKGVVDALRGNFPAVERLVGEAWFAEAARIYALAHPPTSPVLLDYGADFPAFLGDFAPAGGLPYLSDVARLDWLWLEAHVAPDAEAFTPGDAAAVSPSELFALRLALHPSARLAWFDQPSPTIWRMNRGGAPDGEIDWRGEGLVLARAHGRVDSLVLGPAGFAFVDAVSADATLGEAAGEALRTDPQFDLASAFGDLLALGAFFPAKTIS